MNPPLITVVMPAYNAERYVLDALTSVTHQTWENLEIIVIDDGSKDSTFEVVRSHAKSDPRVRIIRQKNAGVSAARNAGLESAQGQYVAFLDADDVWKPEKLAAQMQVFLSKDDIGLVHTGVMDIDSAGNPSPPTESWEGVEGDAFRRLIRSNPICCSSVMVRKELVRPPFPAFAINRLAEDWLLWTTLAMRCRFGYVNRPLVCYRTHSTGTSRDRAAMQEAELLCRRDFLNLAIATGSSKSVRLAKRSLFNLQYHSLHRALNIGEKQIAWNEWKLAARCMPTRISSVLKLIRILPRFL